MHTIEQKEKRKTKKKKQNKKEKKNKNKNKKNQTKIYLQLRVIRAFKSTLEDLEDRRSIHSLRSLRSGAGGGNVMSSLLYPNRSYQQKLNQQLQHHQGHSQKNEHVIVTPVAIDITDIPTRYIDDETTADERVPSIIIHDASTKSSHETRI